MSVSMSFSAGEQAGEIFGVRNHGRTRRIAICPNDLITISATHAEGNAGCGAGCCFGEDGKGQKEEFTTEDTEFTE
jgi:hypothetical protein